MGGVAESLTGFSKGLNFLKFSAKPEAGSLEVE
jgi:hypothetical protein